MSKNSNRSNNDGGFPIFAGILIGIAMGLAIAGGIAWFVLKKNPIPEPVIRETPQSSKPVIPEKQTQPGDSKARFEFYKELTGKPDSTSSKKTERREPPKEITPNKTAATPTIFYLQEGAYTSMADADKVKAKLALLGMVASVQPANIPDKGVWYRVRLGPYKNTEDMNDALATLKLNGMNASPIKTQ